MSEGRLPKRIMFENLEGAVRRGRGGKEKEWTDCVQSGVGHRVKYLVVFSVCQNQYVLCEKHPGSSCILSLFCMMSLHGN